MTILALTLKIMLFWLELINRIDLCDDNNDFLIKAKLGDDEVDLEDASEESMEYFLSALAIPEEDQYVNLASKIMVGSTNSNEDFAGYMSYGSEEFIIGCLSGEFILLPAYVELK